MRHLELLAPARDISIGIAAIDCGADAVYVAGPSFGARQAAGNSVEDLKRLCEHAHLFGAKVYVTVNTIIYDSELEEAARLLEELWRIGADAVIAQDMAVLELNKGRLPLHASTQCSIRTPEKAAELEALGFSRVTLERQLSLEQIRRIASEVDCEVECFVHGALCMCYSGQCYLSEALAGRSANRGACVQACRSRYDLYDSDGTLLARDRAVLSLKDYRLKSRLADLAEAGVTSFKIEGRLKNISYVRNVVRDYSMALDRLVDRSGGKYARASFGRVRRGFEPDTARTFNRGYTAFLMGRDDIHSGPDCMGKVAAMDSAGGMGEELGVVSGLAGDFRSFRIRGRRRFTLSNGDGLAFMGRDGKVYGVRADVCEGDLVKCRRTPELYEGAVICRNHDIAFEREIASNPCLRLIDATVRAEFSTVLKVTALSEDGRRVTKSYSGLWTDMAKNPERTLSMWTTQMSKTGGIFAFRPGRLRSADGTLPLLTASAMNSIRNDLAAELSALPCGERKAGLEKSLKKSSKGRRLTYKDNIANKLAEKIYEASGFTVTEPAYEITRRAGAELMRSKYCLRREMGLCGGGGRPAGPMFLTNNGRRLKVTFDCHVCEMIIRAD